MDFIEMDQFLLSLMANKRPNNILRRLKRRITKEESKKGVNLNYGLHLKEEGEEG